MQAKRRLAQLLLPVVVALSPVTVHAGAELQSSPAPAQTAATSVAPTAPAVSVSADASAPATPGSATAHTSTAQPAQDEGFGVALNAAQLDEQRGGDIQVATSTLNGTVASNVAANVTTGSNSIADGSFANSSGLPTVIQNTGANVLIQNSTILNVHFGN
jgi:hypothetical protein